MAHALAGTPVREQDIIDIQTIVDAYFDNVPDMTNPTQLVFLWYVWAPWYIRGWYIYRSSCGGYNTSYLRWP